MLSNSVANKKLSRSLSDGRANADSQNMSRSKSSSLGFFQNLKEKISPSSRRPPLVARTGSRLSYTTFSSRALMDTTYHISNPLLISSPTATLLMPPTIPPITTTRSETAIPKKSSARYLKREHLIRRKSVPSSTVPTVKQINIPKVPSLAIQDSFGNFDASPGASGRSSGIFLVDGIEFHAVKASIEPMMEETKQSKEEMEVDLIKVEEIKRPINYKRHTFQVDGSVIFPFTPDCHSTHYDSPYYKQTVHMISIATQTDQIRQSLSTSSDGFGNDSTHSLSLRSPSSSSSSSSNQEIKHNVHHLSNFQLYDSELDLQRSRNFDDLSDEIQTREVIHATKQILYCSTTEDSSNSSCSSTYNSSLPCIPLPIRRPKSSRNYSIPSSHIL